MHDNKKFLQVADIIKKTIQCDFKGVTIIDVQVHNELDSDGNDMLRIEVIFEGTPKDIDARLLAGAVRHLRPQLSKVGETAFPLFSFIAKNELRKAGLATS